MPDAVTAPSQAYDVEPWTVRERALDLRLLGRTEAAFALSNGHIGLRANLDEGEPCAVPGTYLNAFYERRPLPYAETAYGLPDDGQTMINVTNGKLIRLLVDDEQFDVRYGELRHHERVLDLRDGVLRREVHWRSPTGRMIRVRSTRMVSLVHRSVAAILYEVEPVDVTTRIVVQSELAANEPMPAASDDPRAAAALERPLRAIDHWHCDLRATLLHTTWSSGLTMAAAMDHGVEGPDGTLTATDSEPDLARVTVTTELEMGQTLRIVKLLGYAWSSQRSHASLRDQVEAALASARRKGWNGLLSDQRGFLADFWQSADVEVGGSPELQQALRFGLFHTLQAGACAERSAIPAKGLTGRGYDGHAFWDMDTFVCAALTYTYPQAAANALRWRHSVLDLAREHARELGRDGAAFPWRTIRGQECSGYWPAGTAAFHINADIAEAVRRYVKASGDEGFERSVGLELLVETARLWRSLGHFDSTGTFRISGVTGPDEYSAIADDNLYTNLMAARNLSEAADATARHPEHARTLGVDEADIESWREAAQAIAMPYNAELGVHEQAAGFTRHRHWDFARTRPDQYPLLLHFPYYELYRSQVVKQADLVLALYLCGERFDADQKARDFNYYEAITVRDSSLSAPLQAIVAAEVGHLELALDYLGESAFVDLHDLGDDTCDGVHLASLAASWLAVVAGFGGMRDHGDALAFAPRLPRRLERLSFRLVYRGRCLRVEVVEDEAHYELLHGENLELVHHGERFTLRRGAPASHAVPPAPEWPVPQQPAGREPRGVPGLRSAAAAARLARGA
ncbi:MAG: alpha,alpha-trehalose phosphorylase [Solirubrobacteraceae bacterium]|nr:alpha,alpha-trehalose phosphorylase [Solirubrobacteraceae bacterium]MEA2244700.1 alpha,alpha-trehalose phosphorylase [Solirubrobacteraceae bacterium]